MSKPVQASSYTFQEIIEGGFLYIDKTRYIYDLVRHNIGIYFLARPRRFGKSLMISTLDEIFHGNKELFDGLWIYQSDYEWEKHPVIRIDFSRYAVNTVDDLELRLKHYLGQIAEEYGVTLVDAPFDIQFADLIRKLSTEQRVVILIDEYDKPIIDNIDNRAEAVRIQERLSGFYSVIKSMDQHIRFIFITGISKFSKVGVFSTMNHLDDLTIDPRFATALGITEGELSSYFEEHINDLAQQEKLAPNALKEKIREWYDGFRFVGQSESVYNPFSTLQLFNKKTFSNYWFETGTPSFLIALLKENNYSLETLESLRLRELSFSTFDIENLSIVPLLFQTGYLTIKNYESEQQRYTLSYPNSEVRDSFFEHLLSSFNSRDRGFNDEFLWQLIETLEERDLDQFFYVLNALFANIPYDIQLKNEKYYQTVFFLIFRLIGIRVDTEVRTNQGRIDAVIELRDQLFLFEFKLDLSSDSALRQINQREYAEKYRLQGKPVILVGANFDSKKRKVTDWKSDDFAP